MEKTTKGPDLQWLLNLLFGQQQPQRFAQNDRDELNNMLGQTPETQFLAKPQPTPTPKPTPVPQKGKDFQFMS